MAYGGALPVGKNFRLPCGIYVEVTKDDIFQTKASAFATGEDLHLRGKGGVTKRLKEICPKTYDKSREELKRRTSEFKLGFIYPTPVERSKKGARVSFGIVFHAIVPNLTMSKSKAEWCDTMRHMYYRLLKAVDKEGKRSLALPLLGSGQAGASHDDAIDILTEALVTYFRPSRTQSHGNHGNLKKIILYIRAPEAFDKMISKLSKHHSNKKAKAGDNGTRSKKHRNTKEGPSPKSSSYNGSQDSEESNLPFILKDLTLENGKEATNVGDKDHEDMEVDDDSFYSDDEEDDEGGEEGVDEEEEKEEEEEEDKCAVCLDEVTNPKKLDKCGHTFCTECIDDTFKHHKPACPTCNTMYGLIKGNQPRGTMRVSRERHGLPGYSNCGMLIIDYEMPSGTQGKEHPNPGLPYHGTTRRAFLPDCEEGKKVYRLLRVAFENRLVFTVGTSRTTGRDNVVTWNDIHHKTNVEGGTTHFAYPDPHYLSRVQEELAAKGVTEDCLKGRTFDM